MSRRLRDTPAAYFAAAGILLAAALASQFELRVPSRERRPPEALLELRERDDLNVVFLLVDTLRADRLGAYGYARPTSPTIDAAAAHGIVFEDVVAQSSWTKCSMASLWTATWPRRTGVLRFDHVIPEAAVLPAERFADAGYRTVGLWRNGWVESNFGFAQGFDVYLRPTPGAERRRVHREARTVGPITGSDEDLTIAAHDFLDRFGEERFFLYAHYMDVHQYAYDEQAAIFGTSYADAYDQALRWTDRQIASLLAKLDALGLAERTVVVIAADHGEAFGEHGREGHARDLYREVTHVPWIIVPPFRLDPGVRVARTVANVDLWPTLLDLVGLPPLPDADGRSLVPEILAAAGVGPPPDDAPRASFGQLVRGWGRTRQEDDASQYAVTHDGLRLIANPDGRFELYDRRADPREQRDRAADDPAAVERLRARLAEHEARRDAPWGEPAERVELDAMRLNHLRALGYVIEP